MSYWQYNLRLYYIRPNEAGIFYYCRKGDIENVCEIFRTGAAKPLDVDEMAAHYCMHGLQSFLKSA